MASILQDLAVDVFGMAGQKRAGALKDETGEDIYKAIFDSGSFGKERRFHGDLNHAALSSPFARTSFYGGKYKHAHEKYEFNVDGSDLQVSQHRKEPITMVMKRGGGRSDNSSSRGGVLMRFHHTGKSSFAGWLPWTLWGTTKNANDSTANSGQVGQEEQQTESRLTPFRKYASDQWEQAKRKVGKTFEEVTANPAVQLDPAFLENNARYWKCDNLCSCITGRQADSAGGVGVPSSASEVPEDGRNSDASPQAPRFAVNENYRCEPIKNSPFNTRVGGTCKDPATGKFVPETECQFVCGKNGVECSCASGDDSEETSNVKTDASVDCTGMLVGEQCGSLAKEGTRCLMKVKDCQIYDNIADIGNGTYIADTERKCDNRRVNRMLGGKSSGLQGERCVSPRGKKQGRSPVVKANDEKRWAYCSQL
ncbi:unnamed protein product [Amoebophrya sp. A25]|nr:unnamed protein product [Amoebophrya sp. A25]|eukprot:GSA25T00005702001.1